MQVFDGPQLTPPRISLLSAADIVPMEGDRWHTGFDLELDGCEESRVYAVCPTDSAGDPKTITGGGDVGHYNPYVLYATDTCSTYPSGRNFFDRAQRRLLAGEAAAIEEQLWTGEVGGVAIAVNPNLADDSQVLTVAGSQAAWEGIAFMDQAIGDCSGGRGMIHVRPQVLAVLVKEEIVRREGNIYLSPMDNIVVGGRGYPGTGPAGQAVGATEWIYGHPGIVQIRRGSVIRLGEDDFNSTVNRFTNDRLVIVERVVHVALDASCCVLGMEIASLGVYSLV